MTITLEMSDEDGEAILSLVKQNRAGADRLLKRVETGGRTDQATVAAVRNHAEALERQEAQLTALLNEQAHLNAYRQPELIG